VGGGRPGGALVGVVPEGRQVVVLDDARLHQVQHGVQHRRGGVVVEDVEAAGAQREVVLQPLADVRVLVAHHQAHRLRGALGGRRSGATVEGRCAAPPGALPARQAGPADQNGAKPTCLQRRLWSRIWPDRACRTSVNGCAKLDKTTAYVHVRLCTHEAGLYSAPGRRCSLRRAGPARPCSPARSTLSVKQSARLWDRTDSLCSAGVGALAVTERGAPTARPASQRARLAADSQERQPKCEARSPPHTTAAAGRAVPCSAGQHTAPIRLLHRLRTAAWQAFRSAVTVSVVPGASKAEPGTLQVATAIRQP